MVSVSVSGSWNLFTLGAPKSKVVLRAPKTFAPPLARASEKSTTFASLDYIKRGSNQSTEVSWIKSVRVLLLWKPRGLTRGLKYRVYCTAYSVHTTLHMLQMCQRISISMNHIYTLHVLDLDHVWKVPNSICLEKAAWIIWQMLRQSWNKSSSAYIKVSSSRGWSVFFVRTEIKSLDSKNKPGTESENFEEFLRILGDSWGFLGILEDSSGLFRILQDS